MIVEHQMIYYNALEALGSICSFKEEENCRLYSPAVDVSDTKYWQHDRSGPLEELLKDIPKGWRAELVKTEDGIAWSVEEVEKRFCKINI